MAHIVYKHFHVSPLPPAGVFPVEVESWLYDNFQALKSALLNVALFDVPLTIVNTAVETEVWHIEFAANELHANSGLIIELLGAYSNASASDNFTLYIKIDNVLIHTILRNDGNQTNVGLSLRYNLTIGNEGVSGELYDSAFVFDNGKTYSVAEALPHVFDTTIAHTISISFKWDNAKVGNTMTFKQGFIQSIHVPEA